MRSLLGTLENFRSVHLLVVGDLMLDRFIWGEVERFSPEAPVPVLRVVSENFCLGGAANVIHNVCTLGGRVTACGIIGKDDAGKRIVDALQKVGASTAGVCTDARFQTIEKTRIIASPRHQQIVRLDRRSAPADRRSVRSKNCAVLSLPMRSALRRHRHFRLRQGRRSRGTARRRRAIGLRRSKVICVVDPKKENYGHYRLPALITPNKSEASEASGIAIVDEATPDAAGEKLLRMWRAQAVLITRGADGMSLFRPRQAVKHFPTEPRDVFDVTGAGDTVVAVCALGVGERRQL